MQAASRPPRLLTLILLSALAILPINVFLPSLPGIAAEFGVDYGTMGLALAGYAAVSACLQLVVGPLSDRFGRRPVILWCLALFILATLGCMIAQDATSFLACRMAQALIAPVYAVSLAVIRDTTDTSGAAGRFGYVAMAWALAPMLGPSLGGLVDQGLGWRAIFALLAALGVALLVLCWFDLAETNRSPSRSIAEQYRVYPRLMASGRYWAYVLCMAFSVGAFYAFLVGAPLAAGAGLSPAILGFYMGSITAGFMLGSFLAGRLAKRLTLTTTLVGGRLLACMGLAIGLVLYAVGLDHPLALFGPCIFLGLANGLTQPAANASAISVWPGHTGSAAALGGAVTVAGGAITAALTGAVLTSANAQGGLLLIMLVASTLALLAALLARRLDGAAAR